jgi:hypothetical protein
VTRVRETFFGNQSHVLPCQVLSHKLYFVVYGGFSIIAMTALVPAIIATIPFFLLLLCYQNSIEFAIRAVSSIDKRLPVSGKISQSFVWFLIPYFEIT